MFSPLWWSHRFQCAGPLMVAALNRRITVGQSWPDLSGAILKLPAKAQRDVRVASAFRLRDFRMRLAAAERERLLGLLEKTTARRACSIVLAIFRPTWP
jgi:hypothetical protein